MPTLLIADDSAHIRMAVKRILVEEPKIVLLGETETFDDMLTKVGSCNLTFYCSICTCLAANISNRNSSRPNSGELLQKPKSSPYLWPTVRTRKRENWLPASGRALCWTRQQERRLEFIDSELRMRGAEAGKRKSSTTIRFGDSTRSIGSSTPRSKGGNEQSGLRDQR